MIFGKKKMNIESLLMVDSEINTIQDLDILLERVLL